MEQVKIIIIEDNRLLREGITILLKKKTDFEVLDSFENINFDFKILSDLKPNVILFDLGLAETDSLQLVKDVINDFPEIKIIIMGLLPIQEDIYKYVKTGVSGFILKDATITDFIETIQSVANGEKILPPLLIESLFSQIVEYGVSELGPKKIIESVRMTRREREVVDLISDGLTNKEIALELNISIYTVKSHVHNILEKMALSTRVQIAIQKSNIESSQE